LIRIQVAAPKSSQNSLVYLQEFAGIISGITSVNKEMYVDILCHLKDAVRRKCPKQLRTNNLWQTIVYFSISWFLLQNHAPAHRLVLVKDFIAKNITTLELPPYSPDMAPGDFYLFPQLKISLKRTILRSVIPVVFIKT